MDSFQAHYADILDPGQQLRVVALLRDEGLVTFSGITDRTELAAVAGRLMAIRPHRDAGPDGVTTITVARTAGPGFAAFTDAELIPHTDGMSVPGPAWTASARLPAARRRGRGDPSRRRCAHHRDTRQPAPRRPSHAVRAASCLLRYRWRPPRAGLRAGRGAADKPPAPARRPRLVLGWRHCRHSDAARRYRPARGNLPAATRRGPDTEQHPVAARPRTLCRRPHHAPHPRRPAPRHRHHAWIPLSISDTRRTDTTSSIMTAAPHERHQLWLQHGRAVQPPGEMAAQRHRGQAGQAADGEPPPEAGVESGEPGRVEQRDGGDPRGRAERLVHGHPAAVGQADQVRRAVAERGGPLVRSKRA
jgi:hypothetical protein